MKMGKRLTVGILAHVDAGKTTLSEALLYTCGRIRSLGRVDHGNTYLDTDPLERERGITVFSKQARFSYGDTDFILLDTPGHADLSPETERTLSLLDYAVLVISAADGVQTHTRTLWGLLEHYGVPTFIFVNKCDLAIRLRTELEGEISRVLSSACVVFDPDASREELDERLALANESLLNAHLEGEEIGDDYISYLISARELFPVVFGSALRLEGVEQLLSVLDTYTLPREYPSDSFGASVYKISHLSGTRLTYMKIMSGVLNVKDLIPYRSATGEAVSEKVNQIRLYSGERYEQVNSVSAGEICAVVGLSATYSGQGLGICRDSAAPLLDPVLSYRIALPHGSDVSSCYLRLKELEEEEPSLHLYYNSELSQIEARIMGEMQTDIIKRLIHDRLGIDCELDAGRILYKEMIRERAIGIGHFEPLRHYAEVQVLLEPLPRGSGLIIDDRVPSDTLALNWRRLILSCLSEKAHRGVLTGALLTDTRITLVAGKAHLKHTEGGDFRQASSRAVRQGLMKGGCVLLEPYYLFRLEIPSGNVGRAMSDLQRRSAELSVESANEEFTTITGRAPVSTLHGYATEVAAYTAGAGRLSCISDGYDECHNADEVIAERDYDPEADLANPPHSVFCANGAGFVVNWREVDERKHIDVELDADGALSVSGMIPSTSSIAKKYEIDPDELEALMLREFGPIRRKKYGEPKIIGEKDRDTKKRSKKLQAPSESMTIIDGYNMIYAWDVLKEISDFSLEKARTTLIDLLTNYSAYTGERLTLVFDAYLVRDGIGSDTTHDALRVVYTREDQTADAFIERMMHELGPNYRIRVVTGDRLVQFAAVHSGISRMTVAEFTREILDISNEITEFTRRLAENL